MFSLKGTHVMEGSGQYLITGVGLNSQTGLIMTLLGATSDHDQQNQQQTGTKNKKAKKPKKHRSVLQVKLGKLAIQVGWIGMISSFFVFLILVARMFINEFLVNKKVWNSIYIKFIISYLIQAITVVVVAVPEGLPLAVALALSFAVQKMTKDNNLVRHLDACETMGNATTICSDKTGTLTTNRMTSVECWIADTTFTRIPSIAQGGVSDKLKELVIESISVNSNYASMVVASKLPNELPRQIGNKTECGLLGLVVDIGGDYEQIRKKYPSEALTKVYTFNSDRKMMGTVIEKRAAGRPLWRLHVKGAAEIVLAKCEFYSDSNGRAIRLDEAKRKQLLGEVVNRMAADGLRTICVAYREFSACPADWSDEASVIDGLVCLCIVGIEDPVRAEVPAAIKKCQSSGRKNFSMSNKISSFC
jgi:Ca2+ transporting ATPase